ncbi:MAG TPA: LysE family translocator [Rhizomicrobium sp.]|jgi:threonine/homoserine/homoserine lactone efflux protein|nr:LysE family translocator [Rhizomicrobium sp.]
MLPFHAYLIYCGVYAVATVAPGPGMIAIVALALGSGFRATIPAALGAAVGDWTLMSIAAFGLSLLARTLGPGFGLALVANTLGPLFLVLKLAGAAYLIFLGCRYWATKVPALPDGVPARARRGFLSQLSLTLGNPKATAFFVALLPTVVDLHSLNGFGYLQLSAASFILIPVIALAYAALASRVRGLLASQGARKAINKTAGTILAAAGVGIALLPLK